MSPSMPASSSLSRRSFLGRSLVAAGLAAATRQSPAAEGGDPYRGFKVGLQSYTLRAFETKQALDISQKLGVHYWESFSKHIPQSTLPSDLDQSRKLLADADVTLLAYGVVPFNQDETQARALFDFAHALNLKSLSADPEPNNATFDLLDKLVEEYGIAIAIHNHGPGHRYSKAADVMKVVQDRHPRIGACVDTGHYLRSDENPVEAIQLFGARVHGVHLKDARTIRKPDELEKLAKTLTPDRAGMLKREGKIFTILGEGELDLVGTLQQLKSLNYQNCLALEYEESEENPVSDVELCLAAVRDAVTRV